MRRRDLEKFVRDAEKRFSDVILPYESRVRSSINRDGTADIELRVMIKRHQDIRDVFILIEEQFKSLPHSWIQTGVRYHARESDPIYDRFSGQAQVLTHYQRTSKFHETFLTGRSIYERLKAKRRLKPTEIVVRLHASKDGKRPKRGKHHVKKKK